MNEYNKVITYRHKSIQSAHMKVPLYRKETPISKNSFIKYYEAIYLTLLRQYSMKQKDYIAFKIEDLIQNKRTHKVTVFKDNIIYYYKAEYCKRYYKRKESRERIPKLTNYYKNYLKFFCKATFSDFKINVIIQGYGKRSAQLYYDQYYSKKRNDNKNKGTNDKHNADRLKVFSSSVRDIINKNDSNNESSIVKDQRQINKNKSNKETDESILHLTCINNNNLKDEGLIINIDNESIMSIVNLFDNNINTESNKEYCQTTTCDTTTKAIKIIHNCKGKLKKLIEEKSINCSNNKAKLKLKANLNPQSDQIIKIVTNLNKKQFNKEASINNKQSKVNNPQMTINTLNNNYKNNTQSLKKKYRHERNAMSIIPTINTIEGTKETVSTYITEYPVINTYQYVKSNKCFSPFVLSSKTITHPNQFKESRNMERVNNRKKMAHIHVKTNSIESKNEIESKNFAKISHRPVLSFSNVFSSYNNYNKQQRQLKNNNYLTMSKGRTISISKEIRKHNSKYTMTNIIDQYSAKRQLALLNNQKPNHIQKICTIIQKHSSRKTNK